MVSEVCATDLTQLHVDFSIQQQTQEPTVQPDPLFLTQCLGEVGFPAACATELCKLNASEPTTVKAMTVADFMALQRLEAVDVLKIDTEVGCLGQVVR